MQLLDQGAQVVAAVRCQSRRDRRRDRDLEDRYYDALPRPTVACCPFCDVPCRFPIDTVDFDGPWSDPSGRAIDPQTCAHHIVTCGVVDVSRWSRGDEPRLTWHVEPAHRWSDIGPQEAAARVIRGGRVDTHAGPSHIRDFDPFD